MLVRRKSACKTSADSSKIFRWLAPLLGPNLDPKKGPKQRPKRRNENVIQFWTLFWGPYLDPKMGVSHRRISLLPANVLQADLRPSSLNMNVNTHLFSLCVPRPLATVEVSLSQPCFEHFFRPCFWGHDEAGLLAFEALRGSPRPARGQASDAKRNGTRTKQGSRGLESIFFSSSLADVALMARSLRVSKQQKPSVQGRTVLEISKSIVAKQKTNNHTKATTRKSPSQTCVSPAEKAKQRQENTKHKTGPEPNRKQPQNRFAPGSSGKSTASLSKTCKQPNYVSQLHRQT